MRKRLGIYGGTFDPVHFGHLRVARAILENFDLDQLFFVPAFVPPHKRGQTISHPHHRYAMLTLATADEPRMLISTLELDAPARPYTIETLGQFQAQYSSAQLFFVMGMDSFRDVPMWREHERLLSEYNIVVAARPGALASDPKYSAAHLAPALQARVVNLCGGLRPQENHLREPHIFVTDYVAVDVSATEIRQAAQTGEPLATFTPPAVAAYIAKYQLYQLAE